MNGSNLIGAEEVAQVIDELPQLLWGLDVPAKEDVATGLEFFQACGSGGVKLSARDAGEEELAEEFGIGHELLGKVKEGEISGGLAGRNGQLKRGA